MINYSGLIPELWQIEKLAASESIEIAKKEALEHLAKVRENIMRMTHEEAVAELIKVKKIENKIQTINKLSDNGLFGITK